MIYIKEESTVSIVSTNFEETLVYDMYGALCGIIRVYNNRLFLGNMIKPVQTRELSYLQIGNSSIYYSKFTNLPILPSGTIKTIYSVNITAYSNGVTWATCPTLSSNKQSINGILLQYGNDVSRSVHIHVNIVGRLN